MMKRSIVLFFLVFVLFFNVQAQQEFLSPSIWLKAENYDKENNSWIDNFMGTDNVFSFGENEALLDTHLINFNRALYFKGDAKLTIPFNMSSSSESTVFLVYRSEDLNTEQGIWSAKVNSQQDIYLTTQKAVSPMGIVKYATGNIDIALINIASQYWGKTDENTTDTLMYLGGISDSISNTLPSFKGDIAEFILFNRSVDKLELNILASYLSLKYGTTLQRTDYLNSDGEVIWSYQDQIDYSYGVAGIGKDNSLNLDQKQSFSTEYSNTLTIGAGGINETNKKNDYVLPDKNFLIWGMNNQAEKIELSNQEDYPYEHPLMQRKWTMTVKGDEITRVPTELQFNIKHIEEQSGLYYLAIDRTGRNNFQSTAIEYILPDSKIGDSIIVFKNIYWDADHSGTDVFTLAFGMNNDVRCVHPICHNEATGKINIQALGAQSPYEFTLIKSSNQEIIRKWNSTSRLQMVDSLAYGTYTLLCKDALQRTTKNNFEISNPRGFEFDIESTYILDHTNRLELDASTYLDTSEVLYYTWESDNGFYQETAQVLLTQPAKYSLTVRNDKGCSINKEIMVHSNSVSNISYSYSLYPNPSNGAYTIDVVLPEVSSLKVSCHTVQGLFISEQEYSGSDNYILRESIENRGVYIITIETSFGVETFKLIIQ